jgi:DNA replication and repair protein RecF
MDEAVVALVPASDTLTSTYERVVRQRNRLLKEHDGRGAPPDLPTWDDQLVETGTAVIEARAAAVAALADAASAAFDDVAGYPLVVRYAPNVPADGPGDRDIAEGFRERLAERRADELQRRASLVGPHRDDLELRSATSAPGGSPATARRGWPRCRSDWPSPTRSRRRSGSRRS